MKRRGYVSPAKAARMLDLHRNTTYAWALAAVAGETSKFRAVERHPLTGYLAIPIEEIKRIRESNGEE